MSPTLIPRLQLLATLIEGRRHFEATILDHVNKYLPRSTAADRKYADGFGNELDRIYNIASFYYIARELSLLVPDNIPGLIARHNADMQRLSADSLKLSRMELAKHDTFEAMIDDKAASKILRRNMRDDSGCILLDTTDLCRFLIPMMPPATCRKTVTALSRAQLVHLVKDDRTFIKTNNTLESLFDAHLAVIEHGIAQQHSTTAPSAV